MPRVGFESTSSFQASEESSASDRATTVIGCGRSFPQENSRQYPFNLWLTGRLSQFGSDGGEKGPSCARNGNPVLQPEPVTVMTEVP
jgi:hypothetical protein